MHVAKRQLARPGRHREKDMFVRLFNQWTCLRRRLESGINTRESALVFEAIYSYRRLRCWLKYIR